MAKAHDRKHVINVYTSFYLKIIDKITWFWSWLLIESITELNNWITRVSFTSIFATWSSWDIQFENAENET